MNWPRLNTRPAIRRRRSWRPSLEEVEGRQLLSNTPLYVLGTNGILWQESPGWNLPGHWRTWVDANVLAFTPDPFASGYLYVEGTNHVLWRESPGWNLPGHSRTWVDANVLAFTPNPFASGYLYVEGTNHVLWRESPGWNLPGHSAPGSTPTSWPSPPTPLRPATCTWRGPTRSSGGSPPAGTCRGTRRTWVDANVLAFTPALDASGYLYVEGTNHVLWRESPGWNLPGHSRTWVDANVLAFTPDPFASGYLYVEGTNQVLWRESPGWNLPGHLPPGSTPTSWPSPPTSMRPATCTWRGPTRSSGGSPPAGTCRGTRAPGSTPTSWPSPSPELPVVRGEARDHRTCVCDWDGAKPTNFGRQPDPVASTSHSRARLGVPSEPWSDDRGVLVQK